MAVFKERVAPPPEPVAPAIAPEARDETARGGADRVAAVGEVVVTGARRAMAAPPAPIAAARAAPPPSDAAANRAAIGAFASRPDEKLGTAHGAREWSVVNITAFDRATPYPQIVRRIEYDTYANLVAGGVIPSPRREDRPPRPFPLAPDGEGYVPDPPG